MTVFFSVFILGSIRSSTPLIFSQYVVLFDWHLFVWILDDSKSFLRDEFSYSVGTSKGKVEYDIFEPCPDVNENSFIKRSCVQQLRIWSAFPIFLAKLILEVPESAFYFFGGNVKIWINGSCFQ